MDDTTRHRKNIPSPSIKRSRSLNLIKTLPTDPEVEEHVKNPSKAVDDSNVRHSQSSTNITSNLLESAQRLLFSGSNSQTNLTSVGASAGSSLSRLHGSSTSLLRSIISRQQSFMQNREKERQIVSQPLGLKRDESNSQRLMSKSTSSLKLSAMIMGESGTVGNGSSSGLVAGSGISRLSSSDSIFGGGRAVWNDNSTERTGRRLSGKARKRRSASISYVGTSKTTDSITAYLESVRKADMMESTSEVGEKLERSNSDSNRSETGTVVSEQGLSTASNNTEIKKQQLNDTKGGSSQTAFNTSLGSVSAAKGTRHKRSHSFPTYLGDLRSNSGQIVKDSGNLEFYGFMIYLVSFIVFGIYLGWALTPPDVLETFGITYYPNRMWAVSLPTYTLVLIGFIYIWNISFSLINTPSLNSFYSLTDEHAYVDSNLDTEIGDDSIPELYDMPCYIVNQVLYMDRRSD